MNLQEKTLLSIQRDSRNYTVINGVQEFNIYLYLIKCICDSDNVILSSENLKLVDTFPSVEKFSTYPKVENSEHILKCLSGEKVYHQGNPLGL